jgi:ABC-type transporter Mla maintaining outer membrane lipid asymmetry ATPase subunit MlaF
LADEKAFIQLKHVTKRFGKLLVLSNLSLDIERGKCLTVIGASGTGKRSCPPHRRALRPLGKRVSTQRG